MIAGLEGWAGLARSLLIYRARPWKITQLARFYAGFLGPGDLAFDIGAHVGNRTHALLRTGASVLAVEPQSRFHAFLRRDLPPGTLLLRVALGSAPGTARLAVSRLHPTVSSIAPDFTTRMADAEGFRHVRWDETEQVEVTTLDALIANHGRPKFIKIDVEGHESAVLRGLGTPVPWIAYEVLPGATEAALTAARHLATLGPYDFNIIAGEAATFAYNVWLSPDDLAGALAPLRRNADIYARLRHD